MTGYSISPVMEKQRIVLSFWDEGLAYFGVSPFLVSTFRSERYEGKILKLDGEYRGCRVDILTLIPHCHGTHLETGAYVFPHFDTVKSLFPQPFSTKALLITLEAVPFSDTQESYSVDLAPHEKVISREILQRQIQNYDLSSVETLIIRTFKLPLKEQIQFYNTERSPFLTLEAMEWLASLGIPHIAMDLPSVDRGKDEGKLANHRLFFTKHPKGSIVEFCYIPPEVTDGYYWCYYAFVPMDTDAVPVHLSIVSDLPV